MKEKTKIIIIVLLVIAVIAAGIFIVKSRTAADNDADYSEEDEDLEWMMGDDDTSLRDEEEEGNGIFFEEELDEAVITKAPATEEDFYGTWTAISDMALYLYGNFTVTILPGGAWKGNITDEDMNGTWKMEGNELHLENEWIDMMLSFTTDGTLIMQRADIEEGEEETFITTVLVKE